MSLCQICVCKYFLSVCSFSFQPLHMDFHNWRILHFDEIQFINFFFFCGLCFLSSSYLLVLSHVNIFIFKIFNKTSNKLKDINSGTSLGSINSGCFHCRGYGLNPWLKNWDPICHAMLLTKKDINSNIQMPAANHFKSPCPHFPKPCSSTRAMLQGGAGWGRGMGGNGGGMRLGGLG